MIRLMICLMFTSLGIVSYAQPYDKDRVVRAYYSGFEKKDWNAVASQLAEGFTFTSPNNDDHISIDKYKEKCWGTAQFVKKIEYILMAEKENSLMLLVQITTTTGQLVRNVDVYTFSTDGKIKSIEVFFGAGSKFPGNVH